MIGWTAHHDSWFKDQRSFRSFHFKISPPLSLSLKISSPPFRSRLFLCHSPFLSFSPSLWIFPGHSLCAQKSQRERATLSFWPVFSSALPFCDTSPPKRSFYSTWFNFHRIISQPAWSKNITFLAAQTENERETAKRESRFSYITFKDQSLLTQICCLSLKLMEKFAACNISVCQINGI